MSSSECTDKKLGNILTRVILIVVTGFLVLAGLRGIINTPVEAQSSPAANLYIEPGTVPLRAPDSGGAIGDGKMVIDLKTGNVWGFPTNAIGSPYPIDPTGNKPPTSKPVYIGRFDFSEMKAP